MNCRRCLKPLGFWAGLSTSDPIHDNCAKAEAAERVEKQRQEETHRQEEAKRREKERQEELARLAAEAEQREKERQKALTKLAAEREAQRKAHGFTSIIGQDEAINRLKAFAALYQKQGEENAESKAR